MFNIGDTVRRILPDTGFGCTGIVQEVVDQGFVSEEMGYVLVQIVQGNTNYPVGSISSWYFGSIELA